MHHSITRTSWQVHRADLTNIRTAVFMQEQQVSAADEWDGLDEQAIHFIVHSTQGEAIGCARLLSEASPHGEACYHIGRVAVLAAFRGQGIGQHLMQHIISYCISSSPHCSIYLHAQCERRRFYERLGFCARGTEFMDAGILHISMWFDQAREPHHG